MARIAITQKVCVQPHTKKLKRGVPIGTDNLSWYCIKCAISSDISTNFTDKSLKLIVSLCKMCIYGQNVKKDESTNIHDVSNKLTGSSITSSMRFKLNKHEKMVLDLLKPHLQIIDTNFIHSRVSYYVCIICARTF